MNNYDLEGVCQDCIYLEKIRPLYEEKDKKIETLEKGLEYAKRIEKDYKEKFDRAMQYIKTCRDNDMGVRYQRIEEILRGDK